MMNKKSIITKFEGLKLLGALQAYEHQINSPAFDKISFNSRLGELLDMQIGFNSDKRIKALRRKAKLRYPNTFVSDINYELYPKLNPSQIEQLATGDWIKQHRHLLIIGPTGMGKTTLACAIAQEAISQHIPIIFYRLATLLLELIAAQQEGHFRLFLKKINRASLLILDDWGNALMGKDERHLFFELIESRDMNSSLLITSQYPVSVWHESFQDSTIADSVLDRIIHNAHQINLQGESIRKLLNVASQGEQHEH